MPRNLWTPEEIAHLRQLCKEELPRDQIAAQLGRTHKGTVGKMHELGLRNTGNFDWAGQEDRLCELVAAGLGRREIADELGCTKGAVNRKMIYLRLFTPRQEVDEETRSARRNKEREQRRARYQASKPGDSSLPVVAVDSRRVSRLIELSTRITYLRKLAGKAA